MTTADEIAAGDRKPTAEVKDLAERVAAQAQASVDGIAEAIRDGSLVQRVHLEAVHARADKDAQLRDALAAGEIVQQNAARISNLSTEQAKARVDEVAADWTENGSYAYGFWPLDDGSVLAVYVARAGEDVQYRPFPSMDATVGWHPIRAPF